MFTTEEWIKLSLATDRDSFMDVIKSASQRVSVFCLVKYYGYSEEEVEEFKQRYGEDFYNQAVKEYNKKALSPASDN